MKVLLQTCCGPCASACVPRLKKEGHAVTLLFANSNIDTREEFDRRLAAARQLAAAEGVAIEALDYDHAAWLSEVARGYEHEPEQGERCARCFRFNLARAAAYARAQGFDGFTSSLTVSSHKISEAVFEAGKAVAQGAKFLEMDFKQNGGFAASVARAKELGLYRQSYCGCEFSKRRWIFHHLAETDSTNLDARSGSHGEVWTADYQRSGRGRLDHKWLSPPKTNLMMSVVLSVEDLSPETVSTFPLVVGLAVAKAVERLLGEKGAAVRLKWPNDVLCGGRKIAGILCERRDDRVIAGIGLNVLQREWPRELEGRATSLALEGSRAVALATARNAVLNELGKWYGVWRERTFAAVYDEIAARDALKGLVIAVRQTDEGEPLRGVCGGIRRDGGLDVAGTALYAGEAHIL